MANPDEVLTLDAQSLDIHLQYLYAEPDDWAKYDAAVTSLGWMRTTLLSQLVSGFMGKHWKYYAECADLEAKARGISPGQFFEECCADFPSEPPTKANGGPKYPGWGAKLTARLDPKARPLFLPSPLATVVRIEQTKANRQRVKTLWLGLNNAALLRVACEVEQCTLTPLISLILRYHFEQYWEKVYAPQIRAGKARSFHRLFTDPTD